MDHGKVNVEYDLALVAYDDDSVAKKFCELFHQEFASPNFKIFWPAVEIIHGDGIIEKHGQGINRSKKIFLILSEKALEDETFNLLKNAALMKYIRTKCIGAAVIPVTLNKRIEDSQSNQEKLFCLSLFKPLHVECVAVWKNDSRNFGMICKSLLCKPKYEGHWLPQPASEWLENYFVHNELDMSQLFAQLNAESWYRGACAVYPKQESFSVALWWWSQFFNVKENQKKKNILKAVEDICGSRAKGKFARHANLNFPEEEEFEYKGENKFPTQCCQSLCGENSSLAIQSPVQNSSTTMNTMTASTLQSPAQNSSSMMNSNQDFSPHSGSAQPQGELAPLNDAYGMHQTGINWRTGLDTIDGATAESLHRDKSADYPEGGDSGIGLETQVKTLHGGGEGREFEEYGGRGCKEGDERSKNQDDMDLEESSSFSLPSEISGLSHDTSSLQGKTTRDGQLPHDQTESGYCVPPSVTATVQEREKQETVSTTSAYPLEKTSEAAGAPKIQPIQDPIHSTTLQCPSITNPILQPSNAATGDGDTSVLHARMKVETTASNDDVESSETPSCSPSTRVNTSPDGQSSQELQSDTPSSNDRGDTGGDVQLPTHVAATQTEASRSEVWWGRFKSLTYQVVQEGLAVSEGKAPNYLQK